MLRVRICWSLLGNPRPRPETKDPVRELLINVKTRELMAIAGGVLKQRRRPGVLPGLEEERLDERHLSSPAVTDHGDVADLGGLGHGRAVFLRVRLQVEKLSRGPSYADPPSSGGSSPCSEGKTGSNDGV